MTDDTTETKTDALLSAAIRAARARGEHDRADAMAHEARALGHDIDDSTDPRPCQQCAGEHPDCAHCQGTGIDPRRSIGITEAGP
jgi:hypothetical protein